MLNPFLPSNFNPSALEAAQNLTGLLQLRQYLFKFIFLRPPTVPQPSRANQPSG
jgi:hypothetical protein